MSHTVILYLLVAAVVFLGAELRANEQKVRLLEEKLDNLIEQTKQIE